MPSSPKCSMIARRSVGSVCSLKTKRLERTVLVRFRKTLSVCAKRISRPSRIALMRAIARRSLSKDLARVSAQPRTTSLSQAGDRLAVTYTAGDGGGELPCDGQPHRACSLHRHEAAAVLFSLVRTRMMPNPAMSRRSSEGIFGVGLRLLAVVGWRSRVSLGWN